MKEDGSRSHPADRIGLAHERLRLGRSRFVLQPRDLTILPPDGRGGTVPLPPHPLVIGLHGMGMRAEIFARWLKGLFDEPWAWFLPEGPYPMERRHGNLRMIGHAWYIWDGGTPAFRLTLRRSEERVIDLLERRAAPRSFDLSRAVLLGFSQGGYFAGSLGLRHAERFRGIAIAGGRIRPAHACRPLAEIPRLPLLFLHGRQDATVPLAEARSSAEEMERHGFPVTFIETEGGHAWSPAMTAAFRDWAARLLA